MTEKEKLVNLLLRGELEASNKGVFNCTPQGEFLSYCGNCGAKMDGGKRDE